MTPLTLTAWGLKWSTVHWRDRAIVLVVDESEPSDIADFWNLRALGDAVIPLPLGWVDDDLLNLLAERLRANEPASSRAGSGISVRGAHRVTSSVVAETASGLGDRGLDVHRSTFPDFNIHGGPQAAVVEAESAEADIEGSNVFDRIPLLSPRAADHVRAGVARWVNVIELRRPGRPTDGSRAAVLPESADVGDLLRSHSHLGPPSTTEGLVVSGGTRDEELLCSWPSGRAALHSVFEAQGLEPKTSDPGYIAADLIRQLGGLDGCAVVQYRDLIKLLDQAANQAIEITDEEDAAERRRPRSRSIPRARVEQVLRQLPGRNPERWKRHLGALIDREVLRVGLRVDCVHCRFAGWYGLKALADRLQCERCLREFPFPEADPPAHRRWAYRPIGPAAVEGYAAGSYAVAFALRFLAGGTWEPASWCTACHLSDELELDFAVLRQGQRGHDSVEEQRLLLGEAKSFGRFEPRDLDRLSRLRKVFPKATLVVATLRSELDDDEKAGLARLAQPSVRRRRDLPWEAPLIVLTALELFTREDPPYCWREAGGRAAELERGGHMLSSVERWADLTAQLHLGLPAHHAWVSSELDRLRDRHQSR